MSNYTVWRYCRLGNNQIKRSRLQSYRDFLGDFQTYIEIAEMIWVFDYETVPTDYALSHEVKFVDNGMQLALE